MTGNGKSERRHWFRVEAVTQVLLFRGRKLLAKGFTENFSKGGALVNVTAGAVDLECGAEVRLELALPRGSHGKPRSLHCVARVLRVTGKGADSLVAVQFLSVSMRNSSEAMRETAIGPKREFIVVSRSRNAS